MSLTSRHWLWKALALFLICAAVGWFLVPGQGPSIIPPFASTPFISGYQPSGVNAGILLYGRRLNGIYEHAMVAPFSPYNWVSATVTLADVMAEGLGNLMAAPGGPANVGRASQLGGGGKFTSSGTLGIAYIRFIGSPLVRVALASPSLAYSGITTYNVGQNVASVITADFNGDSVLDLAVTYSGDYLNVPGGIGILINKGDGTFNDVVNYGAGKTPAGFAAFDVNGDTILDLVIADSGSSNVYVLMGNGNGTFNAGVPYAITGFANSATVADFNGDGKPDIAVAASGASGILLNNGNGTFHSGSTLAFGQYNRYIAAGDFNGDGKLDLSVVDGNSQIIHVLQGSGTGTFQEISAYATSYGPEAVILTDFNHDGMLDMLVGEGDARGFGPNPDTGNIDVLLGRGDGTFQGLALSSTGATGFGSLTFEAVADFTNDGKLDVIANGSPGSALSLFPGNGNGSFATKGTPVQLGPQSPASAAFAGDYNGDGRPDLALAGGGTAGTVSILLNNGSGLGAPLTFPANGDKPTGIAAGDFDGDGKLDLAVANQNSGTTTVFLGGGNGAFQFLQSYPTGKAPFGIVAGDFTGDGKLDLAVTDKGDEFASPRVPGAIYILKNTGSGFATPVAVSAGSSTNPGRIAVGDVNGDGKLDIAISADGPSFAFLVGILVGNGDGSFQPATLLKTDFGPEALVLRDLDGDGKTDIVVTHCCGDTDLTYFKGNGDGTFPPEVHFTGPSSPIAVIVADLNRDGAPDIVVGGNDGTVAGMLNTSTNFPCSFQLDKTSLSPLQQGGTFVINIDAGPSCNWSVSGLPSWITVSGASSGTGPGSVTLIIAPASAARNATISIGGVNVNISQTLAPVCDYSVFPGGQTFPASGGTGTFNVTVNPGCSWSVTGLPAWVTITSGSGGSATANGAFTVAANSGGARSATMTIAGQSFALEQAASSIPGLSAAGSLAQVASEGGWKFILNEVNLGSLSATARVNFYDNNSNPLGLPVTFPQTAAALTGGAAALSTASPLVASTLDRTINPNAQLLVESTGPDSAAQLIGWGEFLTNGSVSGFGIFNHPGLHWEAVVPLETRNASSYFLAFDNTGQVATGLAISSLVTQSTVVQVVIRDDTGTQIGTGTIPLGGKGHTSFMLNQQFPVANGKRGTIEFQTPQNGRISVLGLRANGAALTTLPVLANVTNSGGLIAHATYNGGFTSIYYVTNTGTASADFTLSFFNEVDGTPLSVPLLLPQSGTTTNTAALTRTLGPKEVLVVQTQAVDALASISGSAQLTTTGNISGFEIFQWTTFGQEASVPLETRTPSSFLLAFDNTNGLTTGVALSSASNSQQTVQVILRDDAGANLQTASITLSPRGHASFLLPSNYAVVAGKRGLVEFVVPGGNRISVIGLRAKADGTLTTLPVLAR